MIIESSPTNLDPRVGVDAQSERIDDLIFDDLLSRDERLNVKPGLAESWEVADPLTYVFHLHRAVQFHDGRPLTSRDVKWSFDSLLQGKVRSTKSSAYRFVDRIEAPDDYTVVFHLKEPFATLPWNLSGGAMGIVPYGASGDEMSRHPMGSGPFRFVSAQQDKDVVIEENPDYWGGKARLKKVQFIVVPDTTTRALELRKGSADVAINALTADTVVALSASPSYRRCMRQELCLPTSASMFVIPFSKTFEYARHWRMPLIAGRLFITFGAILPDRPQASFPPKAGPMIPTSPPMTSIPHGHASSSIPLGTPPSTDYGSTSR